MVRTGTGTAADNKELHQIEDRTRIMARATKVAKTEEMIEEIAKIWLEIDFVPQTKKVVQDLLDAGDKPVLPNVCLEYCFGCMCQYLKPQSTCEGGASLISGSYCLGRQLQALEKLLRNRLAFGTAGLRGPMGAGYSRMNPVTVLQCTQGIVAYLEKTNDLGKLKSDGVVIGYDHRDDKAGINSEMMARAGGCGDVSRGLRASRHACVYFMMRNSICIPSMTAS